MLNPSKPVEHSRGAEDPRVIIVEYGDYDCPHTRAAQAVVDQLLAENPDVRVVFRAFPLRHIHANAELLARIAQAAARLGKFWPMHDHLMAHRHAPDAEGVMADVTAVGLDANALGELIEDSTIAECVEADVARGRKNGVHSTPSFFFNGALHDGRYNYETLSARLREARATAAAVDGDAA